jgi:hypothetical protein
VGVLVRVAVGRGVLVRVGVAIGVLVRVTVGRGVFVRVGVAIGVLVRVAVLVGVLLETAVSEGIGVGVGVFETIGVVVRVAVLVGVLLETAVSEGIGVAVGPEPPPEPLPIVITNCGGLAPSRLEKLVAVLLVVSITKLYWPVPVTTVVKSTCVQLLAVIAPELPRLPLNGGALLKLMDVSAHVPLTLCTV